LMSSCHFSGLPTPVGYLSCASTFLRIVSPFRELPSGSQSIAPRPNSM
jgi:hypothetical protein